MSQAASKAGIRKKASPAAPFGLARLGAVEPRPMAAERSSRRGLPTAAILGAALAASLLVTVGCQSTDGDGDDVTAERSARRPARPLTGERGPDVPATGSVVTISTSVPTAVPTTLPSTAPSPIPMALGGVAVPVLPPPPPPPVPTVVKPPKPVSSTIAVPPPMPMPGGMKAVHPST